MYPTSFAKLIELLQLLPGVGAKTAERYAFSLLEENEETLDELSKAIKNITKLKRCKVCGNIAEDDECVICKDKSRDKDLICVVQSSKDVVAFEKCKEFNGVYHVLNGLISTSKGIMPDDINLEQLLDRVDNNTKEVIIATNPTIDGETTALYIDKLLQNKGILVTRLAHGLPMGGHLDYADELTLIKSFENRKKI